MQKFKLKTITFTKNKLNKQKNLFSYKNLKKIMGKLRNLKNNTCIITVNK